MKQGPTPFQFLKEQEIRVKGTKGEAYLGRAMTLTYPPSLVDADKVYHPFLLELTDVLKTPLRENYRVVLKGYAASAGTRRENLKLSMERAERLRMLLIKRYYMKEGRIIAQGYGETDPEAPNGTAGGRGRHDRVEIHITGDVSQALRFIDNQGE